MRRDSIKICNSYIDCRQSRSVLFTKKNYPIFQCDKCGHRFIKIANHETHVSDVYSDDYFFSGKDGYPNYFNERDLLYEQGLRYARLISKYINPGKVLDIGSAAGFILNGFKDSGWSCYGIEPNETMAAYGRDKLGLNIKTGSIETFESNERFDLINMTQVIGHVYNPDNALRNVSRLVKANGLVLVESWNMKSLIARMFGRRWHEYSPPSVIHWYSDKTLTSFFKYYGFELLDKGYPVKKISAEHAISFLEGKASNIIFRKMAESLHPVVKKSAIIYPLLDVKWYLFKKSE